VLFTSKKNQLFPKVFQYGTDSFPKRQIFAGFEQKWQGSATLNKNLADLLNALEGS
jgi:hypothetical protein